MTIQLKQYAFYLMFGSLFFYSCEKKIDPMVHFRLKFDPLQERLNAQGLSSGIASGRAAQTPYMNSIGIQQIELATSNTIPLSKGVIVLSTPSSTSGTETIIDFSQVKIAKENDVFLSIPMSQLGVGRYEWVRVAVSYLNFDVQFNMTNVAFSGSFNDEKGSFATFLGKNNAISQYRVGTKDDVINGNRKQGYWSFETKLNPAYASNNQMYTGQTPDGFTTFVNPIYATSPLPQGACVVTGMFDTPLSITGKETQDMTITLSFSTNRAFEWEETINRNGKWDADHNQNVTAPPTIERVVDAGFRGLKASFVNK